MISSSRAFVKNDQRLLGCQVDAKLVDFREKAIADQSFLDGHVSIKDGVDYSAAKHCRMEVFLQQR